MSRYALFRFVDDEIEYLSACYEKEGFGLKFTTTRADACEYVTVEKAAEIARALKSLHGMNVYIAMSGDE